MHSLKLTLLAALSLAVAPAFAKGTPEEVAKLGTTLTPIGAEKAGNKDGSIPEWKGGNPKAGTMAPAYPKDPAIDGDKPKFTVTKANLDKYKGMLAIGYQELLKRFDTYKLNVYPTRRTVSWPQAIYDATKANAASAELTGSDDITGANLGFPFPIPKSGAEIIWNHKLKWRGEAITRYNNQFIVQPSGEFQQTKIVEDVIFSYANIKKPQPITADNRIMLKYLSQTVAPPRMAGTFILVHDGANKRDAWLYSPGLKRIRRAPTVQYDNPYEGTDGNQFYDQVDMFNGNLDRYNWKLVGKREMIIPYNSNRIGSPAVKYVDLIKPKHANQDIPRYEVHRCWIVEATLKAGTNHTFKKRIFSVDEDSWTIATVDNYDNRDQLYKFQEGHIVTASNIQTASGTPEIIYDFQSGRYFVTAAANEDKPNDFGKTFADAYFTSDAVQKRSTK
jgi:hypothetical protein